MKKFYTKLILFYVLSVSLLACSQQGNKKNIDKQFPVGQIIDTVYAKSDSTQQYSVYLPLSYSISETYPIIYVFDSQANARMVIDKFKYLSDNHNVIIAASYNSKNGLNDYNYIINTLLNDTKSRLSIDTNQIIFSGFSGGARVAGSYATLYKNINSVISIGAGLDPSLTQYYNERINFFAIIGNRDFNFLELKNNSKWLKNTKIRHYIHEFNGKHEWPDSLTLNFAMDWIKLCNMQQNIIPKNQNYIDSLNKHWLKQTDTISSKYRLLTKYKLKDQYFNYQPNAKKIIKLEKDPDNIKIMNKISRYLTNEQNNFDLLYELFINKDYKKINDKINRYYEVLDKKQYENIYHKNMHHRLLNFISMLSYMFINQELKLNNKDNSLEILKIYESVDPENKDMLRFKKMLINQ